MTHCGEGARRQPPRVIAHAYTSEALVSVAFARATSYDALMTPRDTGKSQTAKGGGGCHNRPMEEYDDRDDNHLANSCAAARPMPLAAPVMTATRPVCMTG
jgi:hypothetical protein